jgi:Na+/H+ antiporter NhaD/arsenite permease-like protein
LQITTAVLSAFLDNVTTVLLIVPVILAICKLKVPAYPYLFAEIFASNIRGTATLIGDPPNILIGSQAGLSFNEFVYHLTPVIIVVM